ncbi:MAG: hypothetical protein OXE57_12000 [Alphaproteobacteria bacterium]|nr:hypothetical protein [Alphaproteobacteria bacterium]
MPIAFSAPVTVGASSSASTIAVSGGELKSAKRVQRRADLWSRKQCQVSLRLASNAKTCLVFRHHRSQ